jgi:N-terminal domain of anti-restriction factor ArdC
MLLTSKGKTNTSTAQELIASSINALGQALEAGHSDILSSYLKAMGKFHAYSFGNIILIATQKPTATHVAGIRTWNQLGRRVMKSEKGILIFAPLIGWKRKPETEEPKAISREGGKNGAAESGAKAPEAERVQYLLGFRGVYVWDVAQTEGDELPTVSNTVQGDVTKALPHLIEFVESQGIKLEFSDKISPARGMSYGGMIRVLPDMQPTETLSTLVHELAHEMLHKAERRTLTTKTVRETEAEAVAFVVCHALGLETGTGSSDYIQLYHGDAKLLQESLEVVQRTASIILGAISPRDEGTPVISATPTIPAVIESATPQVQEVQQ